jgi:hypothetical protein
MRSSKEAIEAAKEILQIPILNQYMIPEMAAIIQNNFAHRLVEEAFVPSSSFEKVAEEIWSDEAAHWNKESFVAKVMGVLRQNSLDARITKRYERT